MVTSEGVGLTCDPLSIDAVAFRERGREGKIESALALWRGPALADMEVQGQMAFQAWLAAERDSLATLRACLLKSAVDQAWGHPGEALSAARRLVALEPWNEWGHARVAQLLERCGRVSEASAYLNGVRASLSRELGVPAGELLKTPPPPPVGVTCDIGTKVPKQGVRRIVQLESIKVSSPDEDLVWLSEQAIEGLCATLWRGRFCDVLEGEVERHPSQDGFQADFAVRGGMMRWGGGVQVSLRCVNLPLKTVIWSGQIELYPPFTSGLARFIEGAAGAIGAAIQAADLTPDETTNLRYRLIRARTLASALQPEANQEALNLLNDILAITPDEPDALALTAWIYAQRAVYNWSKDPGTDRLEAREFASLATRTGIHDPERLTTIATARTLIFDKNGAEALLDRALRLDAQALGAHVRSGWLANYLDEPSRALRHFRAAMRIAPLDPGAFNTVTGIGVSYFIRGEYGEAIRYMEQGLALNPKATWIYRNLVPAYICAHDDRKAEEGISTLVKDFPRLTISAVSSAIVLSKPVLAKIAEGLSSAGLPR